MCAAQCGVRPSFDSGGFNGLVVPALESSHGDLLEDGSGPPVTNEEPDLLV
jgi:hypothetical protein